LWLDRKRKGLDGNGGKPLARLTIEDYESLLRTRINPHLGDMPVTGMTPAVVRGWLSRLPANTRRRNWKAWALLSGILNSAVRTDHILKLNPCDGVRYPKPKPADGKALEPKQVEALAAAMPARLQLMVYLAAYLHLRYGEVSALQRRDFDFDANVANVCRQVQWVKGEMLVLPPKNDSAGRISWPDDLTEMIEDHLAEYVKPEPEAWLFPSLPGTRDDGGNPMRSSGFYSRHWGPARKSAGIDVKFHDLRATGLTWLSATERFAEVKDRGRHKTAAAALRYQHPLQNADKRMAATLNSFLPSSAPDGEPPEKPTLRLIRSA
jgi:integrase